MRGFTHYFERLSERFLRIGVRGLDDDIAGRVRAAQIDAIRGYTPYMMVANIGNAIAVAIGFWSSPQIQFVLAWAVCVILLATKTLWSWYGNRDVKPRSHVSIKAVKRALIYAFLLGSLWGILPAVTYAAATDGQRMILVGMIAGMICGSSFALATVPPAAITFSTMITLGAAYSLFSSPSLETVLISAMTIVYLFVVVRSAVSLCNMLRSRILAQITSDDQRDVIGLLLNDFEENATDWLWEVDRNMCLKHVSQRFFAFSGYSEASLLGETLAVMPFMPPRASLTSEERQSYLSLKEAVKHQKSFRDIEIVTIIKDVKHVWSLTAKPIFGANSQLEGYRGVCRDVTAVRQASKEIETLAKYDLLTGLPNRMLFKSDLGEALSRMNRREESFAVLLLDLDHFKHVNDTQGHPVGDALLQEVANRLAMMMRDIDTVARLGGDEFAIILSSIDQPQKAGLLADRISQEISKPYELSSGEVRIGVSIGIAYAPLDGDDSDTLIRHADLALYRAKNDGRGGYHFFEPSLDAASRRRHMLETDLRKALETNALELYFQPLVDPKTRDTRAFEALMRWNHPTLGLLGPSEFIMLAEEVGLIQSLGAWALKRACDEALNWPEHIRVAVNLSAVQFASPALFLEVREALEKSGLRPDRLELEITESLLLDATDSVQAMLNALKALGVRIALDDFGIGYSSLSYLKKYKFDKIKVDRFFVEGIENSKESLAIIASMIRLGQELAIDLTIEGIETESQFQILSDLGCNEIQGYLISRPMPAAQIPVYFVNYEMKKSSAA
jgi:diguanylate cyclase (GGDEF)-like protein/PAS domain S-box-containing protein